MDTTQVPIAEGLFTEELDGPHLLGVKCLSCGNHYFPSSACCSNPVCRDKRTEKVALSREGVLWSYTVQHYPPPPPFRFDEPFKPFAIGEVELPEGLRILGMMSLENPYNLRLGITVTLVLEKAYRDEQGRDVVTWKFRPALTNGEERSAG